MIHQYKFSTHIDFYVWLYSFFEDDCQVNDSHQYHHHTLIIEQHYLTNNYSSYFRNINGYTVNLESIGYIYTNKQST